MIYRENGQFKTSYRADQQILPIRQDRWAMLALLVLAFVVVPLTASDYMFRAVLLPFLIMSLAAMGVNVLVVIGLAVKNLVRGAIGREWMAIRDMDVAASVIGIRPMYAKLTAFAVSSFVIGVAGALWGFFYLGAWEPAAFSVDLSFRLLFMVILGGMGSIMGGFFGAAFIVVLPIFLSQFLPALALLVGVEMSTATVSHIELMLFGALIVWFLIVEPHGLAKLWSIGKQKLRLWPFPH